MSGPGVAAVHSVSSPGTETPACIAGRADVALLGVVGMRTAGRRQQHDVRAVGLDRLAIVLERQIVDPAALERDRALEARRVDGDARAMRQRLLACKRRGRGAPGCAAAGTGLRSARRAAAVAARARGCVWPGTCVSAAGFDFGTKKYCQPNSTTIDSTMARMKLRLFSSMGLSAHGPLHAAKPRNGKGLRLGRSALLCGLRLVHLGERAFKILDQLGEAPLYRARPRDQNIIIALHGVASPSEPDRLLQAPARPIAHHGAAQGLRRGEAESGNVRIRLGSSPTRRSRLRACSTSEGAV